MSVNVAIAGATGAVGQEFLSVLRERDFPIRNIKFLASARSVGKTIEFKGKSYPVEELRHDLRALLQRVRPDWDLSAPGLKQAWARGDRSGFYPYRKGSEPPTRKAQPARRWRSGAGR